MPFEVGRIESGGCLSYLEAEDLRLNELQRAAVHLDEALASLIAQSQHFCSCREIVSQCPCMSISKIFQQMPKGPTNLALSDSSSRLLLAEALHALSGGGRHDGQSRSFAIDGTVLGLSWGRAG